MKKRMRFVLAAVMVLAMCQGALAGCGSSNMSDYAGKWIAIAIVSGDYTIPETAADDPFSFEISEDGKTQVNVADENGSGKSSVKDSELTLSIEGSESKGTIDGDTITFDDMFGTGTKIIFAKYGTSAMNPVLYLGDSEKKALGTWKAESYKEVLDDTPRTSMDGYSSMADALQMTFNMDYDMGYTASVSVLGESYEGVEWSFMDDTSGMLSLDAYNILMQYTDDGKMEVSVSGGTNDVYYTFYCVKSE